MSDDYTLEVDSVGVPRGEGESWGELVDRLDVSRALEESEL